MWRTIYRRTSSLRNNVGGRNSLFHGCACWARAFRGRIGRGRWRISFGLIVVSGSKLRHNGILVLGDCPELVPIDRLLVRLVVELDGNGHLSLVRNFFDNEPLNGVFSSEYIVRIEGIAVPNINSGEISRSDGEDGTTDGIIFGERFSDYGQ